MLRVFYGKFSQPSNSDLGWKVIVGLNNNSSNTTKLITQNWRFDLNQRPSSEEAAILRSSGSWHDWTMPYQESGRAYSLVGVTGLFTIQTVIFFENLSTIDKVTICNAMSYFSGPLCIL